jgi:hypothetical protein
MLKDENQSFTKTKSSPQEVKENLGKEKKFDCHSKISTGIIAGCIRAWCDDEGSSQAKGKTQCNVIALVHRSRVQR